MTCNSLCLWMRAFELNVSLLIRKRRLGDNDICWLWKEKTSNQHTLTRQGLCFLAVLHFDVSMKLWTYKTMWKRVGGQSPASRSTRYLGKEGERLPASAGCELSPCRRAFRRGGRSWPAAQRQELLLYGHPRKTSRDTFLVRLLLGLDRSNRRQLSFRGDSGLENQHIRKKWQKFLFYSFFGVMG